MIDAIGTARSRSDAFIASGTMKSLVTAYRGSPEWQKLSPTTQRGWRPWLDKIEAKFGKAPLGVFNDRRIRGDILDWRDAYADRPRSADMAIQVLSRVLSWGVNRGRLDKNHTSGIDQLYDTNRADIIWTEEDFAAFNDKASAEVREGVELAACTGLRRGDLVKLPWSAVGDHAIIWQTSKSRGKARIVIPLLPETRAVLERIKARHEAEMKAKPEGKRKELPETILSNSMWRPWTPMGFGSRFHDAKTESGIKVNLHDLRGTFATRCMIAGLTDQEIADILGWNTKDVAMIRVRYVDQARVVVAMAQRIASGTK
ncbi:hypothetical protein JI59_18745 [Novosphingobium pentaromativorans US6-1]|nr:hypothetical protein JI59_18745 [Novosphingobium pentaromativorans US6-1]